MEVICQARATNAPSGGRCGEEGSDGTSEENIMILVLPFLPLPHFPSLVSEAHFFSPTVLETNEETGTEKLKRRADSPFVFVQFVSGTKVQGAPSPMLSSNYVDIFFA